MKNLIIKLSILLNIYLFNLTSSYGQKDTPPEIPPQSIEVENPNYIAKSDTISITKGYSDEQKNNQKYLIGIWEGKEGNKPPKKIRIN
jgi:hypothetical protein